MIRSILFYIFSLILLFGIYGCNESHDSSQDPSSFNIGFAPSLAATSMSTVPVNAKLVLGVSTALDPSTVNTETIYLKDSIGRKVHIYVTLEGQHIIISPRTYLIPQEQYNIVVTTDVKTTAGKHLSEITALTFRSGSGTGDTTPPQYLGSNLQNGSIHPKSLIYFQFDEPISPIVPTNIVTITHPVTGENISGEVHVEGTLLYFKPDTPFRTAKDLLDNEGTDVGYTVALALSGIISDLSGNYSTEPDTSIGVIGLDDAPSPTLTPLIATNKYDTNSRVLTMEHIASTLLIGTDNGLHICDYDLDTKHFTPRAVLSDTSLGTVYAIRIDTLHKRLYLGTSKGASIVDIQDLSNPFIIAYYNTNAPVYDVDYVQDHLFLAATLEGVIDLNISTISTPHLIANYNTTDVAFGLLLTPRSGFGDEISIADYQGGLKVVNPANEIMQNASFASFSGQIRSLIQDQNSSIQYLALSSIGGLFSYNLQSTAPPYLQLVADLSFPSYATKVISNPDKTAYINFKYLGIALINYQSAAQFDQFYKMPFEIATFTKMESSTHRNLVLADPKGVLYAIDVQ